MPSSYPLSTPTLKRLQKSDGCMQSIKLRQGWIKLVKKSMVCLYFKTAIIAATKVKTNQLFKEQLKKSWTGIVDVCLIDGFLRPTIKHFCCLVQVRW